MLYSCRVTIAGAFPVGALPYNRSGAVPASEPLRRRRARASWRMTTPPGFPLVSFKSGRLERWSVQRLPQRRRAWINVQHTIPANMNRLFVFALAFFALVGYISCAATGETDCQRRRREEQESTAHRANLLIPECDEHGDYKALQCFGEAVQGKPFCACYDKEFGQIKGPSKNIASCNCVRAHHEWEHSTDENKGSEPKCNATSGAYDQIQCDTNEHWCVDWDTGAQQGLKMNGGCSTDLSSMTCGTGGNHHGHSDGHHGESAHNHGASHDHSGSGSDGTSHHDDHGHHGDSSHHGDAGHH